MYLRYMCTLRGEMAEYHLHARFISRGKGQSAVVGASYIHAEKMHFEREDRSVDLSHHNIEVRVHSEMMIPDKTPGWFRNLIDGRDHVGASEALWNFVENSRDKANAQLAKEIEFAFPLETSPEQNIAMAQEYLSRFTERGMVVDWAFHDKEGNPHAHAYLTLAPMTEEGFGSTQVQVYDDAGEPVRITRNDNGKSQLVRVPWAGEFKSQLLEDREAWAEVANRHLAKAGIDARIDHRSHADRELELEPSQHYGPNAKAMAERGVEELDRKEENDGIKERNREALLRDPNIILDTLTDKHSVFTVDDIRKEVFKHFDEPGHQQEFQSVVARVEASKRLVPLRDPVANDEGQVIEKAHFTTDDMLKLETDMVNRASRMDGQRGFSVKEAHVNEALENYNFLSDEQQAAVRHLTSNRQLASVVGFAGAGKSTLLKAASEAWEQQGQSVYGLALAGKAAEELQESSGIQSRTLHSLEYALKHDKAQINKGDVYVIDEAGMVGSKQMAFMLERAEKAGAKIVLSGDPDQLTPIAAGASMRAIVERTGYAEVSKIRRQKEDWQKDASMAFARGDVHNGLEAYAERGFHHPQALKADAIDKMANMTVADINGDRQTLCLAHTNKDVQAINGAVRQKLQEAGKLGEGTPFAASKGARNFAEGDRLVFLQNDRELGVKNGTLAQVRASEAGHLTLETDGGQSVAFSASRYNSVDHAYAVTVHKAQGATVDNVHVLATRSMTRNLAYVAMTRHRKELNVHYGVKSFDPFQGGIAEALSRRDDKKVSVDYESTVAFGERRGHDTAKALMRAARDMVRGAADGARSVMAKILGSKEDRGGGVSGGEKVRPKKSPQQVMADRKSRRTPAPPRQRPQEAEQMDKQTGPAPKEAMDKAAPQGERVQAARKDIQKAPVDPKTEQWANSLKKDAAEFKEAPGGKDATSPSKPVNFKLNIPNDMRSDPKAEAEKRKVIDPETGEDRTPSILGDAMNLGGVTKDIIEQARGVSSAPKDMSMKDMAKAAKREYGEAQDREKELKGRVNQSPQSRDRGRDLD